MGTIVDTSKVVYIISSVSCLVLSMSVVQISDGVSKEVLQQGNGPAVQKSNTITVHCTGILKDANKKFWSTKDPGQKPFTFQAGVGQVIAGWDEGCMTMRQGETSYHCSRI